MAATLEEVKRYIEEGFPNSNVNVDEIEEQDHRVFGAFRSDTFVGMDVKQRNRLVTEKVREPLGMKGTNVGLLLPLAPGEDL